MASLAYGMGSIPGASGSSGGGDWGFIITMVVIFVIFYTAAYGIARPDR